jgi:hypothetical protein
MTMPRIARSKPGEPCEHLIQKMSAWEWGERNRYAMSDSVHDSWLRRRVVECLECGKEWVEVKDLEVHGG